MGSKSAGPSAVSAGGTRHTLWAARRNGLRICTNVEILLGNHCMNILVTNDDGIHAPGLRFLTRALREKGHEVQVVAPMAEQSAVGHAITILNPLRARSIEETDFSGTGVYGTPADCVKLAIGKVLEQKPDMVISGINAGANVGPDIMYSGTVAAAREAAWLGFPAMAVSYNAFRIAEITEAARFAVAVMERIPWKDIPPRRVMNLNLPARPVSEYKGLALCEQTDAAWRDGYEERQDPRGASYWWLNGEIPSETVRAGSDKALLDAGWATLTPLRFDFTDTACLTRLREAMGL